MTSNVYGGTLNLAQSINSIQPTDLVMLVDSCRVILSIVSKGGDSSRTKRFKISKRILRQTDICDISLVSCDSSETVRDRISVIINH